MGRLGLVQLGDLYQPCRSSPGAGARTGLGYPVSFVRQLADKSVGTFTNSAAVPMGVGARAGPEHFVW